jgi:hypothetical protein
MQAIAGPQQLVDHHLGLSDDVNPISRAILCYIPKKSVSPEPLEVPTLRLQSRLFSVEGLLRLFVYLAKSREFLDMYLRAALNRMSWALSFCTEMNGESGPVAEIQSNRRTSERAGGWWLCTYILTGKTTHVGFVPRRTFS